MRPPVPLWEDGTFLYLRANPTEMKGMLTGYEVRGNAIALYLVTWGEGDEKGHRAIELTDEITYDTSLSGGGSETSP